MQHTTVTKRPNNVYLHFLSPNYRFNKKESWHFLFLSYFGITKYSIWKNIYMIQISWKIWQSRMTNSNIRYVRWWWTILNVAIFNYYHNWPKLATCPMNLIEVNISMRNWILVTIIFLFYQIKQLNLNEWRKVANITWP